MKKLFLIVLLVVAGIGYISAETLTIRIENAEPGNGVLKIGVYTDSDSYPNDDEVYTGSDAEVTDNVTVVVFSDLPKDTYAVAVYQDSNGNNKLDQVFGIPTEDYGFSNNTMIPGWKKNSFYLDGDMTITIKLR